MKKNVFLIFIIFVFAACAKPVVNTKKESEEVRAIVSKIAGRKVSTLQETKVVDAAVQKEVKSKESEFSILEPSKFIYPYENRKDPFYSLMLEREKIKAELEEKKKKEEEERKKAELGMNMVQGAWEKVEIAAILGDGKGFLVLFGGDDTIYQKNDYIDKDKKIKIEDINKNSVNLSMVEGGRVLNKQIEMKLQK
ncbi:MAG: hypothetical protein PHX78_06900 [bacterium]|nr:hypothetical protein [bacterium]